MNSRACDSFPKVVISIVNWNGCASSLVLLGSIFKLEYPGPCRVIVVDNGSRDHSAEHISRAFPAIEILRSKTNLGFAGGHALALERALDDEDAVLIWLLNNDTSVDPCALMELVRAFRDFGECLYGSVPLMFSDGARIDALHGFEVSADGSPDPERSLARFNGLPYETVFSDKSPRVVTDVHGSSFMIPLSVVRKFGFMDLTFFLYAEELDYCFRLRQLGIGCILVPGSVLKHVHGGSFGASERLGLVSLYYSTRNHLRSLRHQGRHRDFLAALRNQSGALINDALAAMSCREFQGGRVPTRGRVFYRGLAMFHALIGRTGKTVEPDDFLEQ